MIVSQGSIGRVFVIRLEDGDRLPDCLERFAVEHKLKRGLCALIGGVGKGRLVVGPENGEASRVTPMITVFDKVREAAALGTFFPDEQGRTRLHMHAALGRGETALAGCVRQGVDIWKLAEVVVLEIIDNDTLRKLDPAFGFEVLSPE